MTHDTMTHDTWQSLSKYFMCLNLLLVGMSVGIYGGRNLLLLIYFISI